ncbi:MAG: protein BatD [Deltaproteobacteria bacterium]|nr:protein BatD [Deltaproteobacteria bacterium]
MKRLLYLCPLLFLITCLIGVFPTPGQAEVRAWVDRESLSLDETVRLIVEVDGAINQASGLDTSRLENDFAIINQSSSSNIQIGNGSTSATKTWTLELEPKKTGSLTIPPFTIGGKQSPALKLTVTAQSTPLPGRLQDGDEVFIEVTPESETPPYIQSQITLSVKLYIKKTLPLHEASLEEPHLEKAVLIKLGDNRSYQKRLKNGVDYQVIERKYAILAEEGTTLTIPPLLFQGHVGGGRSLLSDPFLNRFPNQGRRLRARSQELKIKLLPRAEEFTGSVWLPARELTIKENWDENQTCRVGEPLTRTLRIEALGLSAEQLPQIEPAEIINCRSYPDQPELQTSIDNLQLHAVKTQAMALIPTQPGVLLLPEIRIDWWDVKNLCQRQAVLPERRLQILPDTSQPESTTNSPLPQADHGADERDTPENSSGNPAQVPSATTAFKTPRIWQGVSLGLTTIWLATLLLWLRERRRAEKPQPAAEPKKEPATRDCRRIKAAALAADPKAVYQALLDWGGANWPQSPPRNLGELASRLSHPEIEKDFAELEKELFSAGERGQWAGEIFWRKLEKNLRPYQPPSKSQQKPAQLPPLYPGTDSGKT